MGDNVLSVENEVGGTMIKSRSLLAVSAENGSKFVILYFVIRILTVFYLQSETGSEVLDSSPRPYNSVISLVLSTTFVRIERSSGSVSCPKIKVT